MTITRALLTFHVCISHDVDRYERACHLIQNDIAITLNFITTKRTGSRSFPARGCISPFNMFTWTALNEMLLLDGKKQPSFIGPNIKCPLTSFLRATYKLQFIELLASWTTIIQHRTMRATDISEMLQCGSCLNTYCITTAISVTVTSTNFMCML